MKKLFKYLSIAAVMTGMSLSAQAQQNVVDNDSLSIVLGNISGAFFNVRLNDAPDSIKSLYNKEDIIKGIEYIENLNIDEYGYNVGINISKNIASEIINIENLGIDIDKKLVAEEFKYSLIVGSSVEEIANNENYINKIISSYNDTAFLLNYNQLSISIGQKFGGKLSKEYETLPDSLKYKFTKTAITEIVDYILKDGIYKNESYLTGMQMGTSIIGDIEYFDKLGAKLNKNLIYDAYKKTLLSNEISAEKNNFYINFLQNAENKLKENSPEAIANKKAGEEFIANLKKKDKKIKTTTSGLSYKIIKKGTGYKITDDDNVNVAYKGTLIDGTVFDDSKGEYINFQVSSVVPGFAEGLKLLKSNGSKAIFYIPGNLGYGPQGYPAAGIGPNQMLIFEVEIGKFINEVKELDLTDDICVGTQNVESDNKDVIEAINQIAASPNEESKPAPERIFTVVDKKAEYPGGDAALLQWISTNVQYPTMAQKEAIEGRVYVKFVVEKDGSINKIEIARGCHPELDKEAIRVVKTIPYKFKPAEVNGQAVRSWFTLPLTFKLYKDNKEEEQK